MGMGMGMGMVGILRVLWCVGWTGLRNAWWFAKSFDHFVSTNTLILLIFITTITTSRINMLLV